MAQLSRVACTRMSQFTDDASSKSGADFFYYMTIMEQKHNHLCLFSMEVNVVQSVVSLTAVSEVLRSIRYFCGY